MSDANYSSDSESEHYRASAIDRMQSIKSAKKIRKISRGKSSSHQNIEEGESNNLPKKPVGNLFKKKR